LAATDKVKLTIVRRDTPHVTEELGVYPSKSAALPAFHRLTIRPDVLRAYIQPVCTAHSDDNFAAYRSVRSVRG
jgi:hypothetical protein